MRERRVIMALGSQGAGKTTLAEALVKGARARKERVRGLSPNGSMRLEIPTGKAMAETWLLERQAARDTDLMVFDDADRFIPKPPKDESIWETLFLMNRHFYARDTGVDVLVTGRRAQNFDGSLLSAVDFLYVFQLSRADVNGAKRLLEIDPSIEIPARPYEFLRIEPKTADGNPRRGRVLKSGGFVMDDGGAT